MSINTNRHMYDDLHMSKIYVYVYVYRYHTQGHYVDSGLAIVHFSVPVSGGRKACNGVHRRHAMNISFMSICKISFRRNGTSDIPEGFTKREHSLRHRAVIA